MLKLFCLFASLVVLASGNPNGSETSAVKFNLLPCMTDEMTQTGTDCYANAYATLDPTKYPECNQDPLSADCRYVLALALREVAVDCLVRPTGVIDEEGNVDAEKYYSVIEEAFKIMLAGRMSDATRQFVMETARACFQSPVPTPYSMFHYKREDIRPSLLPYIMTVEVMNNIGNLQPSTMVVMSDCLTDALILSDCSAQPNN